MLINIIFILLLSQLEMSNNGNIGLSFEILMIKSVLVLNNFVINH